MTSAQWLFCGFLIVVALWSMAMSLLRPEEWERIKERDWQRKKEALGGLAKLVSFGLKVYGARKR